MRNRRECKVTGMLYRDRTESYNYNVSFPTFSSFRNGFPVPISGTSDHTSSYRLSDLDTTDETVETSQ